MDKDEIMLRQTEWEVENLLLSSLLEELKRQGRSCSLTQEENGRPALVAPIDGPNGLSAWLYIEPAEGEDGSFLLDGFYASEDLPEGNSGHWLLLTDDSPEEIVWGVIDPFLEDCFMKEQEMIAETVIINDTNLEEFVPYLDDEALTEEGIYAIGIRMLDEDGAVPAGAVSFRFSGEDLVIENVIVGDEYVGIGLEQYAVKDLQRKIAASVL